MSESPHINTFNDILNALEHDPELLNSLRGYILGDDLLQLPALVRQHQEQIVALIEKQAELAEELVRTQVTLMAAIQELSDRMAQMQAAFNAAIQELSDRMAQMQAAFNAAIQELSDRMAQMQAAFTAAIEELAQRQDRMEQRQGDMEERQERMEQRQERMEERQERMEERQERMEQRQERMERDISDIKGHLVPLVITKRIMPGIAMLTNTRSNLWLDPERIIAIAENAVDDPGIPTDHISDGEIYSFYNMDLVMRARDKARPGPDNQVYVVIECSHTVYRDDLNRVRRNADYMTLFTGKPTIAVAAGFEIDESAAQLLDGENIRFFQVTDKMFAPR